MLITTGKIACQVFFHAFSFFFEAAFLGRNLRETWEAVHHVISAIGKGVPGSILSYRVNPCFLVALPPQWQQVQPRFRLA